MDDFIKEFIGNFLRDNAADMAGISKDLVDAGVGSGVAQAIPAKYMTPSLNNLRMKYASIALKAAADEKQRMDRIKKRVTSELISFLWKKLGVAALGALI